jgi:hypothetical protein
MRLGYEVDENAIRFSNYFHVLRELVHRASGRLPLEPSFEVKCALGERIFDDARSLSKVKRRLYELRHPSDYPGAPGDELSTLLDEAGDEELKSALLRAVRMHLEALDPVKDEPSQLILLQLAERQECHIGGPEEEGPDIGALPVRLHETRALRVMPPLAEPARDEFIEVTDAGDPYLARELYVNGPENHVPVDPTEQKHFFHGLMDAELCAAELMARNSHEYPDMPLDFHVDMARQVWDELRHARVHDVLMKTELGCRWGDYPIGFSYFKSVYAHDLLGRLALFNSTSEQKAMWRHSHRRKVLMERGQESVALVFDYLLADEVPHVHNGARWGAYLMGGDEQAYRRKVEELRAGLDETGAPKAAA